MNYYIHPSHLGFGDQENQPHVHVCFGKKGEKRKEVSVSLTSFKAIVTGRDLKYKDQKLAEEFVKNNSRKLLKEWEEKAQCHW